MRPLPPTNETHRVEFTKLPEADDILGRAVVNAAYKVHKGLGSGLLEKVYEVCVAHELRKSGYKVARQINIPINYDGITFDEALRLDLLLENKVIVEIKAIDQVNAVWHAQILSHLKLTGLGLGNLINSNVPFLKTGIR